MSITLEIRQLVRERASYACEFCGVTEMDVGGELTIDHFQPQSKGGLDDLDNLVYACPRCNQYKQNYWPEEIAALELWNPRLNQAAQHFIELEDGLLAPLTRTGEFTIKRLRLNRSPLVLYRKRRQQHRENVRLLNQYRDLVELINEVNERYAKLIDEQQTLLELQQDLLRLLLK